MTHSGNVPVTWVDATLAIGLVIFAGIYVYAVAQLPWEETMSATIVASILGALVFVSFYPWANAKRKELKRWYHEQ